MNEAQLTLSKRGTCIYLPNNRGGFDVRDCPDAEALADRIAKCVTALEGVPEDSTLFLKGNGVRKQITRLESERLAYLALCVELQATVAKLHSQIRDQTVEKVCCGNPIQDNGYVCCGDEEGEWPDWALEAMRTADEMNVKAEQVLGVKP